MDLEKLKEVFSSAHSNAKLKANEYFQEKLGGVDRGACGFAWVTIVDYKGQKINGRTKIGKLILDNEMAFKDYDRSITVWCPGGGRFQNVDCYLSGARGFAEILKENGFTVYVNSRLD